MPNLTCERPHFVRSIVGTIPPKFNIYLYKVCSRTGCLLYDESHQQGQPVSAADLRYWGGITSALRKYHQEGIYLRKLNMATNVEVTDSVITCLREMYVDTLEVLNIHDCGNITTDGILELGSLSNLVSLNIGGLLALTDSDIDHLTRNLALLNELDISHSLKLTDVSLQSIALSPFHKRLTSLKCTHNTNFSQGGMQQVLVHCTNLLTLDLSHCISVNHIGIVNVVESTYGFNEKPMKQYVTSLITHLSVAGCPLRESALDWIGSALPDMQHLDIAGVPKVSNGFVQAVSLGCPNLKSIDIQHCKHIDTTAVLLLAGCTCRTNLVHLDLSFLGPKKLHSVAIMHVLENCLSLVSLDVSGNSNLTDDMFAYEPAADQTSTRSALRKLRLQSCSQVTSNGIKKLAILHKGLEELTVSGLSKLDNEALYALGTNCTGLRVLRANDCLGLSGDGMEYLAERCPSLVELYIGTVTSNTDAWGGRVVQYSDRTLRAILHFCRRLRVLDIRNQCGITMSSSWLSGSRGDKSDFSGHVCLQKIDLLGCDKLSATGMVHVLSKCFALVDVTLPAGNALSGVSEMLEKEEIQRADEGAIAVPKNRRPGGGMLAGIFGKKRSNQMSEAAATIDGATPSVTEPIKAAAASPVAEVDTESDASGANSKGSVLKDVGKASVISSTSTSVVTAPNAISDDKPKTRWMAMFKFCRYATNRCVVDREKYVWGGLFPHVWRDVWVYRDNYIRRKMDEYWAARKVQCAYRMMVQYRKLKIENTAKYLQRWYRGRVIDCKLSLVRDRLYIIDCALIIQRNFRGKLLPWLRSIVTIQRVIRGWIGRSNFALMIKKRDMATQIQKMARGMLVRLSDAYILAQIYVKLPPFWKTVIHSCAPDGGDSGMLASLGSFSSNGEYSERVKMYQITKKRKEVQDLIRGIESNRTVEPSVEYSASGAERKFDLAPKLPFIVPQAFDKNPYVSRADGRKLAFFSDQSSLFLRDSTQKASNQSLYASKTALTFGLENIVTDYEEKRVHQYTFTFWPMQASQKDSEADTTLFDPSLNGFEVRQNMKHTLHCELCGLRLRLICCKQCVKGFCFFCAFKAHVEGSKRNHDMDMIEPRVVHVKESSKSLIYHMEMVQKATYDIK